MRLKEVKRIMFHEHPKKEYCRIARNYHEQFLDFKLPVGAIYGRLWSEERNEYMYFVSTYRAVIKDKNGEWVRVHIKEGSKGWKKERISTNSRINAMIENCIKENGAPTVKSYNKKRPKKKEDKQDCIKINGKRYKEVSVKTSVGKTYVSKEFTGVVPKDNVPKDFDCKHMKPDLTTRYYIVFVSKTYLFYKYSEAEDFCKKHGVPENWIECDFANNGSSVIGNDCSYQAIHKDVPRKTAWSPKDGMYM